MIDELEKLARLFPLDKPLYAVGGCVRDMIMGRSGGDIDLTSACKPEEMMPFVKLAGMSCRQGSPRLGTVLIKGRNCYEYTSFRVDSYPAGSGVHKPNAVRFTDDITEDAKRRDFTVNAIYLNIANGKITDLLEGAADIKNKVLRTVDDPYRVLGEDGLRIMRLYRFVSVLGFKVEEGTAKAAKELSIRLKDIAPERIREELIKTLQGDYVGKALYGLMDSGALNVIMPELALNYGVGQKPQYHEYDVFGHTVHAVEYAPKRIRLAALMHDIGKGACEIKDENMYNHAAVGSEITRKVMERLKFSNAEINRTCALVAHHMIDMHGNTHENKLRKFIAAHADIIDDLTDLIIADARATGKDIDLNKCTRIKRIRDKMQADDVPFNLSQLAVNGEDLKALGYSGKEIGIVLNELLDMCVFGVKRNDKDELLNMLIRRKQK